MGAPRIIIVVLRRPSNPNDRRDDPFWESGSFGCTGCHRKNLMNPNRVEDLNGVRLAFAQGGPAGFRLVKLTGPVTAHKRGHCCEVTWRPWKMPFRYKDAPLLIDRSGKTDFTALRPLISKRAVNRRTWEGRFASKFRSRRRRLPPTLAREIERIYADRVKEAGPKVVCQHYYEALPGPRSTDTDAERKSRYREFRDGLRHSNAPARRRSTCRRSC